MSEAPPTGRARRLLVTTLHGFSCGLPLPATGGTMQAWLTDAGVKTETVGLFSLVGTPYTLKFLWSPLLDRYVPPFLGRRRGWMIVAQGALGLLLCAIGLVDPGVNPALFGAVALAIAFASASQDIVVDAYRRESLRDEELPIGSSLYIFGYRVAMIVAGGVALAMSDYTPWPTVYAFLGAVSAIGAVATFLGEEPTLDVPPPASIREAVVQPFAEFMRRDGAVAVLLFVLCYKLGDNLALSMSMRFYKEHGFRNEEVAAIAKTFGLVSTIVGGFAGAAITVRVGTTRALWGLGIVQALSIGMFVALAALTDRMPLGAYFIADLPPDAQRYAFTLLTLAIGAETFTMGAATSAYTAYMAAQTDRRYTATQYALLSALMGVPRTIAAAPMGIVAVALGWERYFLFCMAMAIPGLALLFVVAPLRQSRIAS